MQHLPEKFIAALASRLNGLYDLDISEARHGDRVLNGRVPSA